MNRCCTFLVEKHPQFKLITFIFVMAKKTKSPVEEEVVAVDPYAHITDKRIKSLLIKINKAPRVKADFEKILESARTYASRQDTPDPQLQALIQQLEYFMGPRNQQGFMDYTQPFVLTM